MEGRLTGMSTYGPLDVRARTLLPFFLTFFLSPAGLTTILLGIVVVGHYHYHLAFCLPILWNGLSIYSYGDL